MKVMEMYDLFQSVLSGVFKAVEVKIAIITASVGAAIETVAPMSISPAHGEIYSMFEWVALCGKVIVYGGGAIGVIRGTVKGVIKWRKKQE